MRCLAPNFFAICSFSSEEEVAMTTAPDATANWSANLLGHAFKEGYSE